MEDIYTLAGNPNNTTPCRICVTALEMSIRNHIEFLETVKLRPEVINPPDRKTNTVSSSYACELKEHDQTMKYLETVENIRSELIKTEDREVALLKFIEIATDLNNRRRKLLKKNQCQEEKKFNIEYM